MPWPSKVVRQFERIPANPSEADFHGAYNKLLYTLFPSDTDFTVVPQWMPNSREAADFLVMFEIHLDNKPVFIVELKPPKDLRYASTRESADLQIRSRTRDLAPECPINVLNAVSAMGTRLCFYRKPRNGPILPPVIQPHPALETDTAPAERWDCDILEEDGMQRFQAIVDEIKHECAGLM